MVFCNYEYFAKTKNPIVHKTKMDSLNLPQGKLILPDQYGMLLIKSDNVFIGVTSISKIQYLPPLFKYGSAK